MTATGADVVGLFVLAGALEKLFATGHSNVELR
jgi:hypothetical protein